MLNEEVLKIVMNDKTFGKGEAASIVGGVTRLKLLIKSNVIRTEKRSKKNNGKLYCNAWDVLKYAKLGRRYESERKH